MRFASQTKPILLVCAHVQIFKSQAARREVIVWSLKLCNETDVFELPERKLLNLVSPSSQFQSQMHCLVQLDESRAGRYTNGGQLRQSLQNQIGNAS